jgi:hypothetical protein
MSYPRRVKSYYIKPVLMSCLCRFTVFVFVTELATYVDVEMSVFAGYYLHPRHDVIKQLVVDLLRQGLRGGLRQCDVQQFHKGLDRPTLKNRDDCKVLLTVEISENLSFKDKFFKLYKLL